MLLLLALACTPEDAQLSSWLPLDEPEAIEALPERTWIDSVGEARFTPDSPAFRQLEPEEWAPPAMPARDRKMVVTDIGETMQVSWEDRDVRLLVRLDRGDLREQIVEPVWAFVRPEGADPESGLWLPPGYTDVGAQYENLRSVSFHGRQLDALAYVPAEAVDHFWLDEPATQPEPPEGSPTANIWQGTAILDAPDGEVLATIHREQGIVSILEEQDGWLFVHAGDWRGAARGWIQSDSLVPEDQLMGFGYGGCCGCMNTHGYGLWGSTARNTVLAEDRLYTEPGGEEIGIALRNLPLPLLDEEGEWLAVEVSTPWGMAEVWVDTWARM